MIREHCSIHNTWITGRLQHLTMLPRYGILDIQHFFFIFIAISQFWDENCSSWKQNIASQQYLWFRWFYSSCVRRWPAVGHLSLVGRYSLYWGNSKNAPILTKIGTLISLWMQNSIESSKMNLGIQKMDFSQCQHNKGKIWVATCWPTVSAIKSVWVPINFYHRGLYHWSKGDPDWLSNLELSLCKPCLAQAFPRISLVSKTFPYPKIIHLGTILQSLSDFICRCFCQ